MGGGVITSCEVRWMMLNPGRCCLVGRCCYVASFVVVYGRGGGGGGGGVITSCEVRWMMLNPGRLSQLGGAKDRLEHRNLLAAYYIHKNPGLDSVLNALRLHREKTSGMVLSLLPTASNSLCGHEDEKGAFFISSMVLQCIITCSTSEQKHQNKRNRTSNG